MSDHILEELWRIREEHAKQFNYDLDALWEDLKRSEAARNWPKAPSFRDQPTSETTPADITDTTTK